VSATPTAWLATFDQTGPDDGDDDAVLHHDGLFRPIIGCFRPKIAPASTQSMIIPPEIPPDDMRRSSRDYQMDDEPKSPAEMKELRLHRKRTQEVEGIKAMAEIAAADIAIRKRTEKLRALRLAKEAADAANPPEPKAKPKAKAAKKADLR